MTRTPSFAVDVAEADWQTVHQAIDKIFDDLAARIQQARPELRSRRETVQAARFQFNYRAFDPPPDAAGREPLVVGIRFDPTEGRIHITGDISTEDSGRIVFDEDCERHTPQSAEEIAGAAAEIAHRLAAQSNLILDYFTPPSSRNNRRFHSSGS